MGRSADSQWLNTVLKETQHEAHAMAHQRDRRPVVKSELGDDVSILGAAALAFDAFDHRDQD